MRAGFTIARPITVSQEQILRLQRNPRTRAVASRILNNEARAIKAKAEELAEQDLRRRPADRRTESSLAHGKEYHDSFEIVPASEMGEGLKVSIRNTHPAARIIENGQPPHDITPRNKQALAFPYVGHATGKGSARNPNRSWLLTGAKSVVPMRVEDGRIWNGVKHPGANGFHIMARALRTYRRSRRAAGGGTTQV